MENFWFKCTKAVFANKQGDFIKAQQLLKDAELVINQSNHRENDLEQRQVHLNKLRTHFDSTKKGRKSKQSNLNIEPSSIYNYNAIQIQELEKENKELKKRLCSIPSFDPLCVLETTFSLPILKKEDFGIILFGHTRLEALELILKSLSKQGALMNTEVWLDGHQGNGELKKKIEHTVQLVRKYPVKHLNFQSGNFGFRKMLIIGLIEMCKKYRDILILEDDCFPTRDAVSIFRKELNAIRNNNKIFSVYGHHFLVEAEKETCARFQGWGWATTSEKLLPILRQLIDCYSMSEERYLEFVKLVFTSEIRSRIEITPPRQPSCTLEKFFAWDETLGLLVALNNQVHRPTEKRVIFNCGMGNGSTHFGKSRMFRKPPFNLVTPEEAWQYF